MIPNPARFIIIFLILLTPLFSCNATESVYVTATGRAYHRGNCSTLRTSRIAVPLKDAARTHNACQNCNPPVIDLANIPQNTAELYRVNVAEIKSTNEADINRMLSAEVVSHIDGDTVRVRIINPPVGLSVVETIRLLGVNTPEINSPNRAAQHFGEDASNFTRERLLGRTVHLAFDWDLRDRYGRLLAYIFTGPGRCFNAELIYEGFGYAYLRYPFQFMEEFAAFEQEAVRHGRGLWASSR